MKSHYFMENNQKAYEYSQELLSLQTPSSIKDLDTRMKFFATLSDLSQDLGKTGDSEKYKREMLKIQVVLYNQGKTDRKDLLYTYWCLVQAQIDNTNYKMAHKTYKHIKLFNLNSMHSQDVVKSFNEDESGKFFPICFSSLSEFFSDPLDVTIKMADFRSRNKILYKKILSNPEWNENSVKATNLRHEVLHLVKSKSEIWGNLPDLCTNSFQWLRLSIFLNYNIQSHMKVLVENNCHFVADCKIGASLEEVNVTLIFSILRLLYRKPLERKRLFMILSDALTDSIKSPSYYLWEHMKKLQRYIILREVIPFITFYVKNAKYAKVENVKKMVQMKNSWMIINHFDKHRNTPFYEFQTSSSRNYDLEDFIPVQDE